MILLYVGPILFSNITVENVDFLLHEDTHINILLYDF